MDTIGKRLLDEREHRGYTLQEVSQKTYIAVSVLRDIEEGKFTKYKGDEQYIKKYIKKYADFLGVDASGLVNDYIELTREITLQEIQEREEKMKSEPRKKVEVPTHNPLKTRTRVYENNRGKIILRYIIIVILSILILMSIWLGLQLINKNNSDFDNQGTSHVGGDIQQETEDTPVVEEEKKEEVTETKKTYKVERTASNQYSITIPSNVENFKFRIEFVAYTWSELKVNNASYAAFVSKLYNINNQANLADADPEIVELSFNKSEIDTMELRNGNNLYHRYYIDDMQIEIAPDDQSSAATDVSFTFIKE